MAQQYPAQEPSKAHLEVHVDSDWAGDTVTRRSTTGEFVRRGQPLLRHSSTVQNVIGLSSAESEYYALPKGGCSGLGSQSLFAGWNLKLQLSLHTDFSNAKAIASRRRIGKSNSSHTDKNAMVTRTYNHLCCPDVHSKPKLGGVEASGIHVMSLLSTMVCDVGICKDLFANVVLHRYVPRGRRTHDRGLTALAQPPMCPR